MSAVQALHAARAAGIHIELDGDDLVLKAPAPPPTAVIDLLSRHKIEVVALLRPAEDGWSADDWQTYFDKRAAIFQDVGRLPHRVAEVRAFEACVIEWLDRNPAPSPAGRCTWCGARETNSAVVLPFGTEPRSHAWLHAGCWPAWHGARKSEAVAALVELSLVAPGSQLQTEIQG